MLTHGVRRARGVTVVDLGRNITISELTAADSGGTLHDCIRELLKQGQNQILVNLRDVSYVDSSGIGELVRCLTTVQSQGGVLKLSSPTERVQNLLRLTHLNTVLDVLEDESTAVGSFSTASAV